MALIRISTYILRRARGASAALGAAYNLVDNAENSSYAEARVTRPNLPGSSSGLKMLQPRDASFGPGTAML